MEVDGYQTLYLMKSHCKMSITKDQSLKVSCSSREVALNIHYIFLVKNVQEVPTFCHGSCVSFNHLLVTGRDDQFACANQEECIHASFFVYDKFLKQPLLRMYAVNERFEISRVY